MLRFMFWYLRWIVVSSINDDDDDDDDDNDNDNDT